MFKFKIGDKVVYETYMSVYGVFREVINEGDIIAIHDNEYIICDMKQPLQSCQEAEYNANTPPRRRLAYVKEKDILGKIPGNPSIATDVFLSSGSSLKPIKSRLTRDLEEIKMLAQELIAAVDRISMR
jgi:hypothetical protein